LSSPATGTILLSSPDPLFSLSDPSAAERSGRLKIGPQAY
jgi:hypothetical protein